MIPHVFTCPTCGTELVGKSKAYARRRGAIHLLNEGWKTSISMEELDQYIKELKA